MSCDQSLITLELLCGGRSTLVEFALLIFNEANFLQAVFADLEVRGACRCAAHYESLGIQLSDLYANCTLNGHVRRAAAAPAGAT